MELLDLLIGLLESDLPSFIVVLILVGAIIALLNNFVGLLDRSLAVFRRLLAPVQDQETRDFIAVRNNFVRTHIYQMGQLNRATDWNDIYYTELEAEVEVKGYTTPVGSLSGWLGKLRGYLRLLTEPTLTSPGRPSVARNLVKAIRTNRRTRAFLIIGDPGSGKTVSLRHLFLEMAEEIKQSKDPKAIVPLYFNLKGLNLSHETITPNTLYNWLYSQLIASDDRAVNEFVERNFERMIKHGHFFFIFDSFDEIPGVMDAGENSRVVQKYAQALNDFIHGGHGCRGLLSSRPYRAPKVFAGQRLTIRSLSAKQIRTAIGKYLYQQPQLSQQVTNQLLYLREDLRHLARNPFYLSLLARYAKERGEMPTRQYELFEQFIRSRVETDADRLAGMGYTPRELVQQSERLAYAMFSGTKIGLEGTVENIHAALIWEQEEDVWEPSDTSQLVKALSYTKIGRLEMVGPDVPPRFSFAHRRFHEYFAARYLQKEVRQTPLTEFAADNRWREVLVLLCEVIPMRHLTPLFHLAQGNLQAGLIATPEEEKHRRAVETLRFLRDGFQAHLDHLPMELRRLAADFIEKQFATNNDLAKKRAVENLALAPSEQMVMLMQRALSSPSNWLRETALRSCHHLTALPEKLETLIRWHLRERYWNRTWREYAPIYRVVFSNQPFTNTVRPYVNFLDSGYFFSNIGIIINIFFLLRGVIRNGLSALIGFALLTGIILFTPLMGHFSLSERTRRLYILHMENGIAVLKSNPDRKPSLILNLFLNWTGWLSSVFGLLVSVGNSRTWPAFVSIPIGGLFSFIATFNFILLSWLYFPSSTDEFKRVVVKWYAIRKRIFGNVFSRLNTLMYSTFQLILLGAIIVLLIGLDTKYGFFETTTPQPPASSEPISAEVTLLLISIVMILFVFLFSWSLFTPLRNVVRTSVQGWEDTKLLLRLMASSDLRPTSASEVSDLLEAFEYSWAKERFVAYLPTWLPVGPDPEILMDVASKQSGNLRDRLFQLAEKWEDAHYSTTLSTN